MLPSLDALLYWTLLAFWGLLGLGVVLLLGCLLVLACASLYDALARGLAWGLHVGARWLYPEYTIPLLLGLGPFVCVAWALLR